MYFTDEVKTHIVNDKHNFVNEFLVMENIGRGSYSKVKRVIRIVDKKHLKEIEIA